MPTTRTTHDASAGVEEADITAAYPWRHVGPFRGGRATAVCGDPRDNGVFYFGSCAGGVWKTTDGGVYWQNVSDGFFGTPSIGAVAVAPSDSDVVWVGTGEGCVRNNVVQGDGVYRSTDQGQTWERRGLEESRHITRVRIHPDNPDVVLVAALGDIFGPSAERGVFRTTDGGRSWERVLFVDETTGAADLYLDPTDPSVAYAAMWEAVRRPWEMVSGGSGSGLYRTTDGGDSWVRISDNPGFARSLMGRMGVAGSAAAPSRLWALVEAGGDDGGLYISEDRGESWERIGADERIGGRPWYYSHIVADPSDADVIYCMNVGFYRSEDAGRSFTRIQTPHGDNHDLWIDPGDSARLIEANDGGAAVSYDRGRAFSSIYNQPTAQIYRMDMDRTFPYDVYGTQQDNSGIRVPTRSWKGAIKWWDCRDTGFAESGGVAVDPVQPRYVYQGSGGYGYAGALLRFDQESEQMAQVGMWPKSFQGVEPKDLEHRFGWTFPIVFSPHRPEALYIGGEKVFRSVDGARSWESISPDLTTNDARYLGPSGGPITPETAGAEIMCTIHSLIESRLSPGELWVGTDDGLVQVTRDGGQSWSDVTPQDLPELATVSCVFPSQHHAGTAYVTAHRYKLQDRSPYLYITEDFGRTWRKATGGLPESDFLRTVAEDPTRADILYLGSESGMYCSTDGGVTWQRLGKNLPVVPVYDLVVRDHELVVATHGRGFWVLDDLAPLRERGDSDGDLIVHTPPDTFRYPTPNGFDLEGEGIWVGGTPGCPLGGAAFETQVHPDGSTRNVFLDGGENPPDGLALYYSAPKQLADTQVTITITDAQGRLIRRLGPEEAEGNGGVPRVRAGLNVVVWDLSAEAPSSPASGDAPPADPQDGRITFTSKAASPGRGPVVPPGTYTITVAAGSSKAGAEVLVRRDPRSPCDDADLEEQFAFANDIVGTINEVVELAASLKKQLGTSDVPDAHGTASLTHGLEALVGPEDAGRPAVTVHHQLKVLLSAATSADLAPTAGARGLLASLREAVAGIRTTVLPGRSDEPQQ